MSNNYPKIVPHAANNGTYITIQHSCVDAFNGDFEKAKNELRFNPVKAKKMFLEILQNCSGHIDALHNQGVYEIEYGKREDGLKILKNTYDMIMNAFPNSFDQKKHRFEWNDENAPLLRLMIGYGLYQYKQRKFEDAEKVYKFLLDINSDDNQVIVYYLTKCYQYMSGKEKEIEELSKKHDVEKFFKEEIQFF